MVRPNIVVIAVDGLRASALGAYGNTTFETPELDRLATESFLADWCFANSSELADVYRALWYGVHPLRTGAYCQGRTSLARQLADGGYHTTLLSDQPELEQCSGASDFDELECIESEVTTPAESIGTSHLAALFGELGERLQPTEDSAAPQLLWLHTRGMYGPWDAPLALRALHAEEDDPEPYAEIEAPNLAIDADADPDARLPYVFSYAAQCQVLDACLGALCDMLPADGAAPVTLVVTGLRGSPLGEHGQVGGVDTQLTGGQLHVPLLVRSADGAGRLQRTDRLVEQADLHATLCDAAGLNSANSQSDGVSLQPLMARHARKWRDHSVAAHGDLRAIRTASWCLQCTAAGETDAGSGSAEAESSVREPQLYVRPDDVIEVNDVADLRADVVDGLLQALKEFESRCRGGQSLEVAPLAELLTAPVE